MTRKRFAWAPMLAWPTSAALLLTACSGGGEGAVEQQPDEIVQESEEPSQQPQELPESEGGNETEIVGTSIDEAVYYAGVEYEFESLGVLDLDEEAGNDVSRILGLELTFDISAYNPGNETVVPNAPSVLRWNEDGGQNVAETNGQGDFKQVPNDSSTTGEMVFTLTPDQLETYDADSVRVILGRDGEATAVLALGAAEETVDRFPVPQEQAQEDQIVAGPLTITMDQVDVRWNYGDPQMGQTEEDEALLALNMTIENTTDNNVCTRRGQGKTMFLKDENGNGYVDLGLTERCFDAGTSTDVFTAIEIPAEFEGTYNLELDVDEVGGEDQVGDIDFDLITGAGVAPS